MPALYHQKLMRMCGDVLMLDECPCASVLHPLIWFFFWDSGRMGIFDVGLAMPASRGSCANGCGNSRKKMLRNERDYKKLFISLHAHKFMLY